MADILQEIVAWKRIEVEKQQEIMSAHKLYANVERLLADGKPKHSMSQALANSNSGIIAEFKRKSPSKGWIHPDVEPEEVVPHYVSAGASALSILTDEKYFGGSTEFIPRVRQLVQTPILRKDFIISEYQLFHAVQMGADAVLLIAACLKAQECRSLLDMAHQLGLEVLLELHGENELDYAELEADMIGVNNRDLGTFHTDWHHSIDMVRHLPTDRVLISESGINQPDTITLLRQLGFRGFLMGECFMKEKEPGEALKGFINSILSPTISPEGKIL